MSTKQSKQDAIISTHDRTMRAGVAAGLSFVKFNKSADTIAVEATTSQSALFALGEELGSLAAESSHAWADALKACKAHADRMFLRAGFVSVYAPLRNVSQDSAIKKFNRLAAVYAPDTSRKAKSNKAKKSGRKEKTDTGKAEKLSEKDVAARMVKALAYISKAQARHAGDTEMLEVLGEIAAILGGK